MKRCSRTVSKGIRRSLRGTIGSSSPGTWSILSSKPGLTQSRLGCLLTRRPAGGQRKPMNSSSVTEDAGADLDLALESKRRAHLDDDQQRAMIKNGEMRVERRSCRG